MKKRVSLTKYSKNLENWDKRVNKLVKNTGLHGLIDCKKLHIWVR